MENDPNKWSVLMILINGFVHLVGVFQTLFLEFNVYEFGGEWFVL